MRIEVRMQGNPSRAAAEEYLKVEIAVTRAIGVAGVGLQADLRAQVLNAGLGRKLSDAWRLNIYPKGTASANAAAMVSTKSPKLVRAFDEGATIRANSGLWLAVPSDACPKKGAGGKRISPSNFPEHVYGPLRFVYRRKGPSMLVVDNQRFRKAGTRRRQTPFMLSKSKRALASGNGLATVPMFFLFPQVKLRKRLDVASVAKRWGDRVPSMIALEFERLDAAGAT